MARENFRNVMGNFTPSTLGRAARHFSQQAGVERLANARAATALNFSEGAMLPAVVRPKDQLRILVGKLGSYPETVGGHPDFDYLTHDQTEMHYIVSVFADIKGSTKLATVFPLEDVRQIKNGSLTTMIDIFQAFDGHIHRLQGDGMLVFFGRKDMRPSQAIIDALNAASFLQYYFQNVLRPMFESRGFPPIGIRVGIDFGLNDKVLWSRYGIRNCDEVTTTSMHTDLAAKLQGRAKSNGIMIGDNVKSHLDLPDEFYCCKTVTRDGQKAHDRYVLNYKDTLYSMWQFEWEKYMNRFLCNPNRLNDGAYKAGEHFSFSCNYKVGDTWVPYQSNCKSLAKEISLQFVLDDIIFTHDLIEWRVINRGYEAGAVDSLDFKMDNNRNKKVCSQVTAYTGHHYMECIFYYQGRTVSKERIGVYVNDN